jgi:hypothetical protein
VRKKGVLGELKVLGFEKRSIKSGICYFSFYEKITFKRKNLMKLVPQMSTAESLWKP